MLLIKKLFPCFNNKSYFFLFVLLLFAIKTSAQNDTIFFNKRWKNTNRESAEYYRIKPLKISAIKAFGYKIGNIDSLYVINDYYFKSKKIQFQGYSQDIEGNYIVGNAKWYNEKSTLLDSRDFNYKENRKSKLALPKWPILYLDYKIATKSQFIAGLEFCLDCENKNKLFLGFGFGLTSYKNTYYGLPDLHLSYNTEKLLFVKGGVSNKHAYALTGITLLNLLDLGVGYSQPFNTDKIPVIKGFTFGATFRFSSNQKIYTKMRFM